MPLALGALLLALFWTPGVERALARPETRPVRAATLTILFTNDIHGKHVAQEFSPNGTDERRTTTGGFAALQAAVERIRREAAEKGGGVLLLDTGDLQTGGFICNLEVQGARGGALMELMNAAGYDAWCLGNHDFDDGLANTVRLTEIAEFPTVATNLRFLPDHAPPAPRVVPEVILERDGVKIGILGFMSEELVRLVNRDVLRGVEVKSYEESIPIARAAARRLRERVDVVVALTHWGDQMDNDFAARVEGIDVVLGGHSHTPFAPKRVGKAIVAQSAPYLRQLGRLSLELDGRNRIVAFEGELLELPVAEPQGRVADLLAAYDARLSEELSKVVGQLEVPWQRAYRSESNIGDFLADALMKKAGAECAFLNSGGIRRDVSAGGLTKGIIYEIYPFRNELVVFEVSGEELRRIIEHNAWAAASRHHGILQVAGVRYAWRRDGENARVLSASCGGEPIDPERRYLCATNDFVLFDQPEKYLGFRPSTAERLGHSVGDVVLEAVQAHAGPIRGSNDGRISEKTNGQ